MKKGRKNLYILGEKYLESEDLNQAIGLRWIKKKIFYIVFEINK